jgi:glycosyltransferase involved in cell wall biosynthesis
MSNPQKIVIIGPAHPLRGGLASYDERLAREFMNAGFQTTIYTFSLQYPSFLFPGTTQYSSEPAPTDLDIRVKINSINPLNWIRVGKELKALAPEIIVVRYWLPFMGACLGKILRIAKKNGKTRVVCIADNVIPHEKRPGDLMLTNYFLAAPDAFITMSEKVLADLNRFSPGKPAKFVAHPLYDNFGEKISKRDARQHLDIDQHIKLILFFGFIRHYKGLDILLEAMKILADDKEQWVREIRLMIAGEFYEDEKKYTDLVEKLKIRHALILRTNFISDSEVKYYLCAADCVVQPYRSATQSGVTPLAYHFEKPMIVTNVGGLPSLVPDGKVGLVAEPDPASIAASIKRFYELGESHFENGLKEEKVKYSWNAMMQAILEISKK